MTSGPDPRFWQGRRVFLTGHTGFKGAWAALWLQLMGAKVYGFALAPDTEPNLWSEVADGVLAGETLADLADREALARAVETAQPDVVLHMAAQALVRASYADPVRTTATNVMGAVHLLEALRGCDIVKTVLVVTTDKVYANDDSGRHFVEADALGGYDPYSASKAAAEIMTKSYAGSFLEPRGIRVATARAGNVIGGGDWSPDRLVPDVWRAAQQGRPVKLRSPGSTRPWQHVLDPLAGYFRYVEALSSGDAVPRSLNFGPPAGEAATVAEVAERVGTALGMAQAWQQDDGEHPREMNFLSLDPALAEKAIGWRTRLGFEPAIEWTARWYADHVASRSARDLCIDQICRYQALA
mgnify:CR=1 FL=1